MANNTAKVMNYKGEEIEFDPTSHASNNGEYGIGNDTLYGHLKLMDTADNNKDVNSGYAVTPKALANAATSAANMSNVTEGVLKVSYGGTGQSTLTNNAVITGNGTGAVKPVTTANGALFATTANGAPSFGTLPLAQGGTGRTSSPTLTVNVGSTTTGSSLLPSTGNVETGITGTLGVGHGGTGLTTSTYKNALIKGNASTATSDFSVVRTASGALYATTQDSAPSFGTLPVAQGGTGVTDFSITVSDTTLIINS